MTRAFTQEWQRGLCSLCAVSFSVCPASEWFNIAVAERSVDHMRPCVFFLVCAVALAAKGNDSVAYASELAEIGNARLLRRANWPSVRYETSSSASTTTSIDRYGWTWWSGQPSKTGWIYAVAPIVTRLHDTCLGVCPLYYKHTSSVPKNMFIYTTFSDRK
jgi:hypothetical protein